MKASTFLWIGLGTAVVGAGVFLLSKYVEETGTRKMNEDDIARTKANLQTAINKGLVDLTPKTLSTSRTAESLLNQVGISKEEYNAFRATAMSGIELI